MHLEGKPISPFGRGFAGSIERSLNERREASIVGAAGRNLNPSKDVHRHADLRVWAVRPYSLHFKRRDGLQCLDGPSFSAARFRPFAVAFTRLGIEIGFGWRAGG
jgi:hypothetical protein